MKHNIPTLALAASLLIAAPLHAAFAADDLRYRATIGYGFADRSGNGSSLENNSASLTLSEKLSTNRTQFLSLSGNLGDFTSATNDIDNKATSIAYGMSWGNVMPGLTLFASGYASHSWNDYDRGAATGGKTATSSSGIGVVGGANQLIPVSAKSAFSVGSGVSVGHSYIDDIPTSNSGNSFGITPYVQFSHAPEKDLHLYARFGTMLSNRDVTLSGGNALYTPTVGFNKNIADVYSVGASYSREFAPGMQGNRLNLSLSRAF